MTPSQYDPRYQDLLPQDPKFKMCKVMTDKVMCFAAGKNFIIIIFSEVSIIFGNVFVLFQRAHSINKSVVLTIRTQCVFQYVCLSRITIIPVHFWRLSCY